jgi:hypothetical protein
MKTIGVGVDRYNELIRKERDLAILHDLLFDNSKLDYLGRNLDFHGCVIPLESVIPALWPIDSALAIDRLTQIALDNKGAGK